MLDLQNLWARLLAKEGKREEAEKDLHTAIQSGELLRSTHTQDLRPVYFVSNLYRELAAVSAGPQKREALLRSAAAWRSWPSTSYTQQEEQSDLAASRF